MEKVLIVLLLATSLLKAEFAVKSYKELRNEHVTRQTYEQSCGASSIATLLNLSSPKQYSEKDILKTFDDGKAKNTDMVSFAEISSSLSKLGYENKGYQISRSAFESIAVPIIVKIENDPRYPHFVVVINHPGDFITVLDPSFGEYVASKREFYSVWDRNNVGGYALIADTGYRAAYPLVLPNTSLVK